MAEVPKRVKGIPRSIQETIVMIRAACVAVPRYKEQEEAIKTRCINAELEFFDLYDMTEKQLSDDLGVGMGFCRVLLQSAKETAIGLTEGDKGFFLQSLSSAVSLHRTAEASRGNEQASAIHVCGECEAGGVAGGGHDRPGAGEGPPGEGEGGVSSQ